MIEDVIVIHGYKGDGSSVWIPWLSEKLEKRGYNVIHPDMPNSSDPILSEWIAEFEKILGKLKNEIIVVGHSLGGSLILHMLENEMWTHKLKRAIILGAPVYSAKAPDFFRSGFKWNDIRKNASKLTAVWSKDDDRVGEENINTIEKELSMAEVVRLDDLGHFMSPEFDWLLQKIIQIDS